MRVLPYGDGAVLLETEPERVPGLVVAVRAVVAASGATAADVVPGARTVLVDGLQGWDLDALVAAVRESDVAAERAAGHEVEVPTTYDGADLDEVARLWDMTRAEVVATHTGTVFTVAFCGFAPGFAYCTGLPADLHVPRRPSPRARVPSGSVGLAGEFTGVYPSASPGGWQLLGRTALALWDSAEDPPARLAPGTVVRFVEDR